MLPPTRVSRSCIRDTPPPVSCEKRLQTIENKGKECRKERKETGKRQQMPENNGFATPTRPGQAAARRHRSSERDWRLVPPHPGAMRMVVKIKGLREKQFVRIGKQRADKKRGK